jgi:hypothetical protein
MPEPVMIQFGSTGLQEVSKNFSTIEARLLQMEKTSIASSKRTTVEQEKNYAALVKQAEKWQREQTKGEEREAKQRERVVADETRRKEQIIERSAVAAGRFYAQQASAEIRERERAASESVRIEERKARAIERAHSSAAKTIGGSVIGGTSRVLGGAAAFAGGALAIGGGFAVADAVRGQMGAERVAAQLVNAVTTTGKPPSGASVADILKTASGVAVTTGMSKEDIIKGSLAYSRSARGGDYGGAKGNMEFFAKMAKATGVSIEDLGSAAGVLQSQNADLGKNPKAMQQLLLNAYAQSKSGSVSLVDAAKQFGTLGSTRGLYQGDEAKSQQTLIGLGQIAASGGNVSDIGTYIKDLSLEAAAHRKGTKGKAGLESMGVKFDSSGRMESPEQMIGAVFKGTGGDLGKIHEIFGNRGMPLFTELSKSFRDAGGGDKGVAAVQKQIAGVTQSSMSPEDLQAQFAQVMSTSAEKFDVAIERIKDTMEGRLAPLLDRFADALAEHAPDIEKIVNGLGDLATWLVSHPFEGMGALVLGSIAKDLAAAKIGEMVKSVIKALLSGSSAGSDVPGIVSSGGGLMGKLIAGAGGLAAFGAGVAAPIAGSVAGLAYMAHEDEGKAAKGRTAADLFAKSNEANPAALAKASAEASAQADRLLKYRAEPGELSSAERKMNVAEAVGYADELKRRQGEIADAVAKAMVAGAEKAGGRMSGSSTTDPNNPARNNPMDQRTTPN